MFLGSKVRPVRGAATLPLSVSRLATQCGILSISQPYRRPRPVTGIALLFFSYYFVLVDKRQAVYAEFYQISKYLSLNWFMHPVARVSINNPARQDA
jgi:hypothetical protein